MQSSKTAEMEYMYIHLEIDFREKIKVNKKAFPSILCY